MRQVQLSISARGNHAGLFSRKVAAVTDKTILYDLPGIRMQSYRALGRRSVLHCRARHSLLIQVLIAKTSNAGLRVEPQDALYDGQIFFCQTLLVSCEPFTPRNITSQSHSRCG